MPFWTVFAIVLSAVSFTASYVQAKKAQKRAKRLQDEMAGVLVNKESNIEAIPVVYGERRVGGVRVYMTTSGDDRHEYLYVALVVSEGRVESISDLEIDEVPANDPRFTGLVSWHYKLGDDDQTTSTVLDDSLITVDDSDPNWEYQGIVVTNQAFVNNFRLRGVAYVAIRLKYDAEVFAGVPDFTVKVKGRRVYDPRKDSTSSHYDSTLGVSDHRATDDSTWDWTDNPALCLRDYLTNDRFGKGLDASDIDDDEFMQAADDIDSFTVTPYSGGSSDHKLFSLNAVIDTNEQLFTNVEKILLSCRGFLPYTFGKYGLKVDQAGTSVMTLGTDKIIGDISIVGSRKEDRFNQVIVKFPDANTRFQPNNVAWPDQSSNNPTGVSNGNGGYLTEAELHAQFLTEDGELLVDEIDLEHCTDIYQARDLARIFLWRSRNALNVALQATSEAMELTVGDVVSITHPTPNWTAKKFQVDEMGINYDGTVTLKCVEYDATIYAYDSAVEQEDLIDIITGDPGNVQAPTNVSGNNTGSALLADGTFHAVLNVSWTASQDATVIEYEVRYKLNSESAYKYLKTTETSVRIEGMTPGTYNIGVRALDAFGGKSAFTDGSNVNASNDTTVPGKPINFSAIGGLRTITAVWDNPVDSDSKDLAGVEVYIADSDVIPSSPYAKVNSEEFVYQLAESEANGITKYFWLKSFDYTGNVSAATNSFNGTSLIPQAGDADGAASLTMTSTGSTAYGLEVNGTQVQWTLVAGTYSWNHKLISDNAFIDGAQVSFRITDNTSRYMIGLSDESTGNSFTQIDYAFFNRGTNDDIVVYESGTSRGTVKASSTGDELCQIIYDGTKVRYLIDGSVVRTVDVATRLSNPIYLHISVDDGHAAGTYTIKDIAFSQYTSTVVSIEDGVDITGGGITLSSGGAIKGGQTEYDDADAAGFFLGYTSNAYKFSIGNSDNTKKLTFDGSDLLVTGAIQGGSIQSNNTDPIPTDVFTRTGNTQNIPTGDESGAFIDLASGSFLFGDADSFVSFAENSDATAFELDIKGVLAPTTLDFSAVTDTTVMPSNIKAQGYVDASIGVDAISDAVWNEIDSRVGQGSGGFYTSATGNYLGAASQYITIGTTQDHGTEDVTVKVVVSDTFAYPRNFYVGSDQLKIKLTLEYKVASGSTWVTAGSTQTRTLTPTILQYATRYTIDESYSVTLTTGSGGDLADGTDYDFRVKLERVGSQSAFADYNNGGANDTTGTPILLEVSENASGVAATGGNADTLDNIDSTGFLRLGTSSNNINNTAYGNLTITGNLTVQGTQTTLDTATLQVQDKNIVLNYGTGDTSGSANGAGITIQDGVDASNDASILWRTGANYFDVSHAFGRSLTPSNATGLYVSANNVNATALRIFQSSDEDQLSDKSSYGFSLNYRGDLTGNDNKLVLLADNQQNANQNVAFEVLQDGKMTIAQDATFSGTVTWSGGGSANANTAYSWGDHSAQGYLTSADLSGYLTAESDTLATVTGRGATTTAAINTGGYKTGNVTRIDQNGNMFAASLQMPSGTVVIDASRNVSNVGTITSGGKLKVNQAGTGTSNSESPVAALSGQSSAGGTVTALSLVNSITAANSNGVALAFHTASNYSPTGRIVTKQEASGTISDSRMIFQIYRGNLKDAVIIDHDENMTVGGSVTSGGNLNAADGVFVDNISGGANIGIGAGQRPNNSVGHTATEKEGIFWHTDSSNDYGIFRTVGAWQSSSGYSQLETRWITGIRLDGGTAYTKSGVRLINNTSLYMNDNKVIDGATRNITAGTISSGAISATGNINSTGHITAQGYLQAYNYLYTRSDLRVLNAAGTGWTTWGSRSNGNYNLSVGTISSGAITASGAITVSGTAPVMVLNDSDATNNTNQIGYVSFQRQGTETGYVGFGSGSNSNVYLSGGNNILLRSAGVNTVTISNTAATFARYINLSSGADLRVNSNIVLTSDRKLTNSVSFDPSIPYADGVESASLHTNEAIYATAGDADPLNGGLQFNVAGFKTVTMYTRSGSTWTNQGNKPSLTDANASHHWSGVGIAHGTDEVILYFGAEFGYAFCSLVTMTHETRGNSMRIYLESSESGGATDTGWNEIYDAGNQASWPGSTTIRKAFGIGASFDNLFRIRLVPNWTHASNSINLGQIVVRAGYGTVSRLFEWDSAKRVKLLGPLRMNGTDVMDTSRNMSNLGTITASGLITTSNSLQVGSGYNLSWGGAYADGKPTIAANTNTIYFYPTGDVSGQRLYLNATGLVNEGTFTSGGSIGSSATMTLSGNGTELQFSGGNNRIKFSGYRALEGSTDGANLQIGEGYTTAKMQADVQLDAGKHLTRSNHHTGHLEGSYNNIGNNATKSNPIYTIGSSYNPNDADLGNMYGIGYSRRDQATFLSSFGGTHWGMYVAADGDARIFLNASSGVLAGTGGFAVGATTVIDSSRNVYPYQIRASGGDDTPAGTQFSNVIKGQGTNRTVYFDGNGSSVSTWYGVGNNAYAAIDCTDGVLDVWVNDNNNTWRNVADFATGGLNISYGGFKIASSTVFNSSRDLSARQGTFTHTDHNYLKVENTSVAKEQMIRFRNSQSNYWYAGIRTSNGIASTADFHIYSTALGDDAFALTTSGDLVARRNLNTKYGGVQINGTTVINGSRHADFTQLVRTNTRITQAAKHPVGHYSQGEYVFAIDPTWSQAELQTFFNSSNVTWNADSTAPGGYAIYINGGVNVGGAYNSGFPYIPVEDDDVFEMECWIRNVGGGQRHYMGSNEYNQNFGSLGGNPGSYGYWVMSNTDPGTSWKKYTATIRGFSATTVGRFENGTKYWTPMALFNYGAGSGTRACYISGWKVRRVTHRNNMTFGGKAGNGQNARGRYLSIEGNTGSTDGEGSGRIFFTEHNSTTGAMDNYGMSMGYRGGSTTIEGASGNNWTGLSQIGNGQWGMWGHNNNASGELIMYGDRAATFINFSGNLLQNMSNVRAADGTGTAPAYSFNSDPNTGMFSGGADVLKFTTGGTNGLTINATDIVMLRDYVSVKDYLRHYGDSNTYFRFTTDRIRLVAGGITYIDAVEGATDYLRFPTRAVTIGNNTAPNACLTIEQNSTATPADGGGSAGQAHLRIDNANTTASASSVIVFNADDAGGNTRHGAAIQFKKSSNWGNASGSYPGELYFWTRPSSGNQVAAQKLDKDGNAIFKGNVTAYGSLSDRRLKQNIENITDAVEKVQDLNGVTFEYKKDGKRATGLIAQDLEQVLPEAVYTSSDIETGEEHKAIHYGNVVGLLVEAIKEQQDQIDQLKEVIKEMSNGYYKND